MHVPIICSLNADRRWLCEEHVLHILSASHVPEDIDGSYIAEIVWRYSQEFDSATRLCLGSIIIIVFILLEFKFNSWKFAEYVGIKVSYT